MAEKQRLDGKLPLDCPEPCPICGAKVVIEEITEWGVDDGFILHAGFGCVEEPDIDSDEWWPWFNGHYSMPYVDWLPWENRMMKWLNRSYYYDGRG